MSWDPILLESEDDFPIVVQTLHISSFVTHEINNMATDVGTHLGTHLATDVGTDGSTIVKQRVVQYSTFLHVFQYDNRLIVAMNNHIKGMFTLSVQQITNKMVWMYDHVIPSVLFRPAYGREMKMAFEYLSDVWRIMSIHCTKPLTQLTGNLLETKEKEDDNHVIYQFNSSWITDHGTMIRIQFQQHKDNSWHLCLFNRASIVRYKPSSNLQFKDVCLLSFPLCTTKRRQHVHFTV